MSDDFCLEHGYEFMQCEKVWGAIPHCTACDAEFNPVVGTLSAANVITQDHIKRFGSVNLCGRCNGGGWLDAIEGSDGSYITSRPCPRCTQTS